MRSLEGGGIKNGPFPWKLRFHDKWEVEHFAQLKQRILAKARQILPETPPHSTWPNPEVRGKRIFGSPQMSIV